MAYVCDEAETDAVSLDAVADTVVAVVRHTERCNTEVSDMQRHIFLQIGFMLGLQLRGHAIVSRYTLMHLCRGVDGDPELRGNLTDRLDMVSVIVGHQDGSDTVERKAKSLEMTLERANAQSRVDENRRGISRQVIAVTAATAALADKLQHSSLIFNSAAKLVKKMSISLAVDTFFGLFTIKDH